MPVDKVDCIWVVGPGSYGRNDADDCAMDAAVLAKAVGRPVRLQYTREQGTGWDPKGPASIHRARAAIDAAGKVVAYEFLSKGFSRIDVQTNGSKPRGHARRPLPRRAAQGQRRFRRSGGILRVRQQAHRLGDDRAAARARLAAAQRRTCAIRSGRRSTSPANRSWTRWRPALGVDPVELRLRHVKDPRDAAVLKAAAEKSGWAAAASPRRDQTGNTVTGRGIAYSQRNGTTCAIVAEVDVDRRSGKIWARKFTVAHDCGQIINPDGLKHTIEGNIIQGISRTLWEEVKFDQQERHQRRLADLSDPRHHRDAGGDRLRLINRPELAPTGAGEPSIRPVAAAIANAIFDATGVRLRRVPFSPERVKGALS